LLLTKEREREREIHVSENTVSLHRRTQYVPTLVLLNLSTKFV